MSGVIQYPRVHMPTDDRGEQVLEQPPRTRAVCKECLALLVLAHDARECEIVREHAVWGGDYPALQAEWDNPEDEVAFDVSDEAQALICAPLEYALREIVHDLEGEGPPDYLNALRTAQRALGVEAE